jgi:hypothetical protein
MKRMGKESKARRGVKARGEPRMDLWKKLLVFMEDVSIFHRLYPPFTRGKA